jgi:hypothetical protein
MSKPTTLKRSADAPRRMGKASHSPIPPSSRICSVLEKRQRLESFLARLARMSVEERVRAARHGGFTAWERAIWAARFPQQVPLVNGEFEWIAFSLADLD